MELIKTVANCPFLLITDNNESLFVCGPPLLAITMQQSDLIGSAYFSKVLQISFFFVVNKSTTLSSTCWFTFKLKKGIY